mgnify:FL=1
MPRWLVALVLAVLVPCYGFAAVGQSVAAVLGGQEHMGAHLADEPHHHHDDGSVHADASDEAVQHLHVDDCVGHAALIVGDIALDVLHLASHAPSVGGESPPPGPFLEGLKRPPRSELA